MNGKDEMPMLMSAKDIQAMGLSRTAAYALLDNTVLPVVYIGKRKFVQRDIFFKWLESREKKPDNEQEDEE